MSIAVNIHNLTAETIGEETTDSYLAVGRGRGFTYCTVYLSVIPFDRAKQLSQQYGDFRKCSSSGASEGKNSIQNVCLYAENPDVETILKKIEKISASYHDSLFEMRYIRLTVPEYVIKMGGLEIKGKGITEKLEGGLYYLVTDIKLMDEDYKF